MWITRTTDKTHNIIEENLKKSPVFSGSIEGFGPRYCPSMKIRSLDLRIKPHIKF